MPTLRRPVLTRLDPARPPLWRDGATLQFGRGDKAICVDASDAWVEPLLATLMNGFRRGSFDLIAHGAGAPRRAARALFERIGPLLVDDPSHVAAVYIDADGMSDGRVRTRMSEALTDLGVLVTDEGREHGDTVHLVLSEGASAAVALSGHLRDDIAHLPIAFEPDLTEIGPLVLPGQTPCLSCRDAAERESDDAWALLHAQRIGRPCGLVPLTRVVAAADAAAALLQRPTAGGVLRASVDGRRVSHSVTFHAECLCRQPSIQSLPGIGKAPVALSPRREPTTEQVFARLA